MKEFETITLTGKATDGTEISESFYSERYKIVPSRGGSSSGGTGIPVSGGTVVAKVEVRSAYDVNGNGGIALGMPDCYVGYVNYLPVGNYVLVFTLSTLTRTMAVL